jgi:signal transduction histidine kinase
VKFSPSGGSVLVTLKRVDNDVQLSVRDDGEGIDGDALPRVFDWFWQGDAPQGREPSGLGLGLGIVRQLVEIHGGSVHAESEGLGLGSRFVVTLPLVAESGIGIGIGINGLNPNRDDLPVRSSFDVH